MAEAKILCMLSGGIDSTGALWQLLTDTKYNDYTIMVHHVRIMNHENRAMAEYQAVTAIIEELNRMGKKMVHLSMSAIDFRCFPYPSDIPYDTDSYGFIAANLAVIDKGIKFIASGSTLDDARHNPEFNQNLNVRRNAIMDAVYVGREFGKAWEFIYPVEYLTKKEIYQSLPESIRSKTWSCRRPIYEKKADLVSAKPCNQCTSCKAVALLNNPSYSE